jgi:hypothetical protein
LRGAKRRSNLLPRSNSGLLRCARNDERRTEFECQKPLQPRGVGWAKRTQRRCRHERRRKRAHHSRSADDGGHGANAPLPTLRSRDDKHLHSRGALRPSPASSLTLERQRAQGMPVQRTHPQPCVQWKKARKQVTTGTPKHPAFPARWFTAYGALSSGCRA